MLRIHGDQTSLIAALTKDWRHRGEPANSSNLADLMSHWAEHKLDLPQVGKTSAS